MPLETDAWGIDVVVSGSQKALMTPPGLAFASVSDAALAAARRDAPRFYFDWERTRKAQAEARRRVHAGGLARRRRSTSRSGCCSRKGLEAAFERHVRLGRACREGVKAMGLELFSPDEDRSAVVTAIRVPDGIDAGERRARRCATASAITLAGGQGELKGKIFRIGHIG